ncbi:MAG: PIN domain-containing protein, partial [Pseudomonadota bacterium]
SRLVKETNAHSKPVTDAWFAALAIEHGCEWVTLDKDFGRFKGLKWRLVK